MSFLHSFEFILVFIFLLFVEDYFVSYNMKQRKINDGLWYALKQAKEEEVKILLKQGANPNHYMSHENQYVLCAAIFSRNKNLVDLMLQNGARLHDNDDQALEKAMHTNDLGMFIHIYQKGFDIKHNQHKILVWCLYQNQIKKENMEILHYICEQYEDKEELLQIVKKYQYNSEISNHIQAEIFKAQLQDNLFKKTNLSNTKIKI